MTPLTVSARRVRNACVIEVAGDLTLGPASEQMRVQAEKTIAGFKPAAFVIDLTAAGQLDSAGLGELVNVYMLALDHQAQVAVVGAPRSVMAIFEMTRVDAIFPNYPTQSDAIAATGGL